MRSTSLLFGFVILGVLVCVSSAGAAGGHHTDAALEYTVVPRPTDGGVREDVPKKYRARYERWKAELLATDIGRSRWETFANDRHFDLVVRISEDRGQGAGTDRFQWDSDGHLVGATITLGPDIDSGYPPPVYYPVLNAMSPDAGQPSLSSSIVAAVKFAHELSHVSQAAKMDASLAKLQTRLIPQYVSIFLGKATTDRSLRLADLEVQMGGTPTRLWEEREYTSEVEAMHYLAARISDVPAKCRIFRKIRQNLNEYARAYEDRFDLEAYGTQCIR